LAAQRSQRLSRAPRRAAVKESRGRTREDHAGGDAARRRARGVGRHARRERAMTTPAPVPSPSRASPLRLNLAEIAIYGGVQRYRVPLDHLAANLDPGYECLERGQGHRAARDLLALPPERLVQLGASMPCSCSATMVSPTMTFTAPVTDSVRRLNVRMATRRPSIPRPCAAKSVAEHRRGGVTASCAKAGRSRGGTRHQRGRRHRGPAS
jgi:hypothetical protein